MKICFFPRLQFLLWPIGWSDRLSNLGLFSHLGHEKIITCFSAHRGASRKAFKKPPNGQKSAQRKRDILKNVFSITEKTAFLDGCVGKPMHFALDWVRSCLIFFVCFWKWLFVCLTPIPYWSQFTPHHAQRHGAFTSACIGDATMGRN